MEGRPTTHTINPIVGHATYTETPNQSKPLCGLHQYSFEGCAKPSDIIALTKKYLPLSFEQLLT